MNERDEGGTSMYELVGFLLGLSRVQLIELNKNQRGRYWLALIANMGDDGINRLFSSFYAPLIRRLPQYVGEERLQQYLNKDENINRLLSSVCGSLSKRLPEYVGIERFKQYLSKDENINRLISSQCVALIKQLPQYVDEKRLKEYCHLQPRKRQRVQLFSLSSHMQLLTAPSEINIQPLDLSMS